MADDANVRRKGAATRRIRRARPDDLDAVTAIEALAFEPARRSSRRALLRALRSPFQRPLVLEVAERGTWQVAGYVVVWPFRHTWRVYNLAADPARRQQGIGSALMCAVESQAAGAGARRVVLEARHDPRLLRFYEQRGYRRAAQLPDYYAPGEPAVRFVLRLPADGGG